MKFTHNENIFIYTYTHTHTHTHTHIHIKMDENVAPTWTTSPQGQAESQTTRKTRVVKPLVRKNGKGAWFL